MDEVMFNIRMLAAYKRMSIDELAKLCGISSDHLKQVSCGRVKMTADDIVKLSKHTGIPADRIEH